MPTLGKRPPGSRIAFVGKMAAGKTTAAKYLVDNYDFEKHALADKLKSIAYEMFGVTGKDGNDRIILQKLGTEWFRSIDPDVWTKYLLRTIEHVESFSSRKIVVDDARFINEAELLRQNGFSIIRIVTPESERVARMARLYPSTPPEAFQHASEQEQDRIRADYEFNAVTHADLFMLEHIISIISGDKVGA